MKTFLNLCIFFICLFCCLSCEESEVINTLSVSMGKIEIPADGGTVSFTLETDADSWNITNPATNWISIPFTSGNRAEALISLEVETKSLEPRVDTITISAGNAPNVYLVVSQVSSEYVHDLSVNLQGANFNFPSDKVSLNIESDAPQWNLHCDAEWVEFSHTDGDEGSFSVTMSVTNNQEITERSTTVYLSGEGAPTTTLTVKQNGIYPSYNTDPIDPDITGMSSTALEIANKMTVGWNIGNTLEAIGGETAWGNPNVTEDLIKLVKANGFNAIRIPCSWNQNLEQQSPAKIKESWLARVKEVVQYCVNNDMYTILNIHWDQGWLETNCTQTKQFEVNAKQKALWEQIATYLRDFDEHLIFASANEPNVENVNQMNVLLSYHQTFIDAVRSTGGKNAYRVLVVQGPSTNVEKTYNLMNTLPTDQVPDKLMAEIHYYTPFQYCLMTEDASWGEMFYYWGEGYHSTTNTNRNASWGEESTVDDLMELMNIQFVRKGIPVIMGEYAVIKRSYLTGEDLDLHLKSRAHYLNYVTMKAKENGIIPFYWDAGNMGNNASALFNRATNIVYDQQAIDAIIDGASTK